MIIYKGAVVGKSFRILRKDMQDWFYIKWIFDKGPEHEESVDLVLNDIKDSGGYSQVDLLRSLVVNICTKPWLDLKPKKRCGSAAYEWTEYNFLWFVLLIERADVE